jgi:double-stranded uracil-DNA glycosylase
VAFTAIIVVSLATARQDARSQMLTLHAPEGSVWLLPNPSGLNAHYKPADFGRLYAEARLYAESLHE